MNGLRAFEMQHSFRKFVRYARVNGLGMAVKAAVQRIFEVPKPSGTVFLPGPPTTITTTPPVAHNKIDVLGYYNSFIGFPHGNAEQLQSAPKLMQWVIPSFGFGSGGHLNIFRFMNMLAARGHPQRLVILPPHNWSSVEVAKAAIAEWYFPLNAEVAFGVEGFVPAEITLATGWQTAYWVSKHRASKEKFYFVQDFEPLFHSISSEYFLAENTYKLGLKAITAGTWLAELLTKDYNMRCGAVSFSCDHKHYYPRERREQPNFNILFYSRHVSRRRLFELGMAALAKVCAVDSRVAVIFAGGDVGGFDFPYKHLNCGELTLAELPDLYSQCDLAVVLSGTNLSLLPLEVAACKCPVVMNDSPSARWLLPDDAAYYAPLDPDGMADVIVAAIQDNDARQRRAEAGYSIAQASSWEVQADKFLTIIEELKG